jgi:hypothetical protein
LAICAVAAPADGWARPLVIANYHATGTVNGEAIDEHNACFIRLDDGARTGPPDCAVVSIPVPEDSHTCRREPGRMARFRYEMEGGAIVTSRGVANLHVVHGLFDAIGRGDLDAIRQVLAPDVTFTIPRVIPSCWRIPGTR